MDRPSRPDPYEVLGLHAGAAPHEVASAYRRLLRRYHPDTRDPATDPQVADAALRALLEAYAQVRHEAPRRQPEGEPEPTVGVRVEADLPRRRPARGSSSIRVGPLYWSPAVPRRRA